MLKEFVPVQIGQDDFYRNEYLVELFGEEAAGRVVEIRDSMLNMIGTQTEAALSAVWREMCEKPYTANDWPAANAIAASKKYYKEFQLAF